MINIPNPDKREKVRRGRCFRCGDFAILKKGVWNDPYTDMDGEGWLCEDCYEKTQNVRSKYQYDIPTARREVDLSKEYHPVPKPEKKKKKNKRGGEE